MSYNIIKKTLFFWKKPCVVIVVGRGRSCAAEAIFQALKNNFKVRKTSNLPLIKSRKEILVIESDLSDIKRINFLIQESRLPILVATHIGDIPPDRDFFDSERRETSLIRKLARIMPKYGYLILNFDDETVREIKNESPGRSLTYGFQKGANFKAGAVRVSIEGTSFKLDHEGRIVPFRLKRAFGKEQIYSILAAVSVGVVKGINLVGIFQSLKSYQPFHGKMKLLEGINSSFIIDSSENSSVFSMLEALNILGQIRQEGACQNYKGKYSAGRGIAVLGDVLANSKYLTEAHQTIGEKAGQNSDLLFTVGPRAKFIAQGARSKGMKEENIFELDTVEQAKTLLQKTIKKEDVILVDGSKEMKMSEIVKEIKA